MLSMAVHRGLPVALPTSSTAKIERHQILSVTIDANGSIFLEKERIALEDLRQALKQRTATIDEAGVRLFAEKSLTYQRLFRVLDEIKKAGLTRVSLQAEADSLS
jgi:biopolymer transport protein ExbD